MLRDHYNDWGADAAAMEVLIRYARFQTPDVRKDNPFLFRHMSFTLNSHIIQYIVKLQE